MINILFLGGAKRVSFAEHCMSSANAIGQSANIFSYELEKQVPIACVGTVVVGKRWSDADVIDDLKALVKKQDINIVLPFVDPAIKICALLKKECPGTFIPVSDIDTCETMYDKIYAADWFAANGIAQPRFFKKKEDVVYPVIMKPRTGSASKGLVVCRDEGDLPDVDFSKFLCSEYVEDRTEFSVDCYVDCAGIPISIVPRIRVDTAGGEVVKSVTIRDEEIIKTSNKILSSGMFRGPITIQFMRNNRNGELLAMEVNPRFGGGVVTSIGAGSGVIEAMLRESQGEKVVPMPNWDDGVVMARYFKEVVFHADNH